METITQADINAIMATGAGITAIHKAIAAPKEKNPKLVEAGRKGMEKRRANMTPEEFSAFQRKASNAQKRKHADKLSEWGREGFWTLTERLGWDLALTIVLPYYGKTYEKAGAA